MTNRTMLKIEVLEHCITFRTVSHKRKSGMFYLSRKELEQLIAKGYIITRDLYRFAEWSLDIMSDSLNIKFYWLNSSDGINMSGYIEYVEIKYSELSKTLEQGIDTKSNILARDNDRYSQHRPKLVFHQTGTLHNVLNNKIVRRKFVRAIRDGFRWPAAEKITFYNDSRYSFYWIETYLGDRRGLCGGLIFHCYDGDLSKGKYSIHT